MTSAKTQHRRRRPAPATPDHVHGICAGLPAAIHIHAARDEFDFTYLNDRAARLVRRRPGAKSGRAGAWISCIHQEDRDRVLHALKGLKTGARVVLEYRLKVRGDHDLWVRDELVRERSANGQADRIVGCWFDITAHKVVGPAGAREKLLAAATEAMPTMVAYIDRDQIYRFANRTYQEWVGVDGENLIGRRIIDVVGKDIYRSIRDNVEKALGGGGVRFENTVPSPHGGARTLEAKYTPHVDDDGAVQGFVATIDDITARRQAEDDLAARDKAIDSSPIAVSMAGFDGQLTYVNQAFLKLWGYGDTSEVLGRHMSSFWQDPTATKGIIESLKQNGMWVGERVGIRSDGEHRTIQTSATLTPATLAHPATITAHFVDVTNRKDTEAALRVSEERLAGILAIAEEAIISVDNRHRIRLFNAGAEQIFGYAADDVIGQPLDILVPARYRGNHSHYIQSFADAGESSRRMSTRGELVGLRRSGAEFPATAAISKLHLGSETIFTVTLHDITEQKRAESALQRSEDRWCIIAETTPIPLAITRLSDGKFLYANPKWIQVFGADPKDLDVATSMQFYGNPAEREVLLTLLKQQGEIRDYDLGVVNAAGEPRTMLISMKIMEFEGVEAILSGFHDITDRVLTEGKLKRAMDEATSASRAKSEFLALMSHELRTPLNAVIGFSDIIRGERFGPIGTDKYRDYASHINDSGQHLLSIINDILDISKVEAGKEELHEENIDVPKLVASVSGMLRERAARNAISIELDLPGDVPTLRADPRKVKQILVNILTNGVKFTPRGGTVRLSAWTAEKNGYVFQIVDTGVGMALHEIPLALSLFGQVDCNISRKHDGTGLGLPLSKSLVELHGGSLDLQSEVGKGTTVTIRFPADRVGPPARGSTGTSRGIGDQSADPLPIVARQAK